MRLGTGEREPSCLLRIRAGSCQPLSYLPIRFLRGLRRAAYGARKPAWGDVPGRRFALSSAPQTKTCPRGPLGLFSCLPSGKLFTETLLRGDRSHLPSNTDGGVSNPTLPKSEESLKSSRRVRQDSRPTHRDKAAMNGAQTFLFVKLRRVDGWVSGAPAGVVLPSPVPKGEGPGAPSVFREKSYESNVRRPHSGEM